MCGIPRGSLLWVGRHLEPIRESALGMLERPSYPNMWDLSHRKDSFESLRVLVGPTRGVQ